MLIYETHMMSIRYECVSIIIEANERRKPAGVEPCSISRLRYSNLRTSLLS
jgi:hypothetical protein